MMKIIISIFMLSLVSTGLVHAQNSTTVSYAVGFGTGDVGDYIGKTSFRGLTFDFEKSINPQVGIAFSMGYNLFYEEVDYNTYVIDNVSLSGRQWRYSTHVPLLISGRYYFSPDEIINPFVGLGVGTIYSRRETDMSVYAFTQDAWNFALQPMAGILYEASDFTILHLSARYHYGFQAGSELQEAQSFITLNIGATFRRY